MNRNDRNYKESLKCYLQALKFDFGNLQILKDISLLQIQIRDYKSYLVN